LLTGQPQDIHTDQTVTTRVSSYLGAMDTLDQMVMVLTTRAILCNVKTPPLHTDPPQQPPLPTSSRRAPAPADDPALAPTALKQNPHAWSGRPLAPILQPA